jgi:capsid protein
MQKLMVRELLLTGEVFIVLVKSPSAYPQLMLVTSENVRKSDGPNDNSIDGVYVDSFAKVTAYNIFTGSACQKVDASNVIHLMRHKYIGQLRGIGAFAASLNTMRDIKDLLMLEKSAVKTHSLLAAVVTKNNGEAVYNGAFGGIDTYATPDQQSPPSPPAQSRNTLVLERALKGTVSYMEPGEKVELLSSDRSTEGFLAHVETLIRDVCLNISIPYEFLVNADKLTGTGIRFAISDAAFYFANLQNILIDGALSRIYAWVTASFINDGKVKLPQGDYFPVSFTRPISITVDSQRVTNAEIALLQNSLQTYESFYSARGKDWKAELKQKAQEEAYLDELSKEYGVSVFRLRALMANNPASGQAVETDEADQQDHNQTKVA